MPVTPLDFSSFLDRAHDRVDHARREQGFARFEGAGAADLYGTAAAVGVRIALGDLPTADEATTITAGIRALRDPAGLYRDSTHGVMHRCATAVATLAALGEPADAPPSLEHLLTEESVAGFLGTLNWDDPWPESHRAAGLLAIGILTRQHPRASRERWLTRYLEWLDAHADRVTGLWLSQRMGSLHDDPGLFGNLACAFHLHFLYRRLGRPWPSPEGVVDVGLSLLHHTDAVVSRGDTAQTDWGFRQLDWVYSVARAAAVSDHRREEVTAGLEMIAVRAAARFDEESAESGDLHVVQARVGLVAELAQHLPMRTGGLALTSILDLRPFI